MQAILDDILSLFCETEETGYQGYFFLLLTVVFYRFFQFANSKPKKMGKLVAAQECIAEPLNSHGTTSEVESRRIIFNLSGYLLVFLVGIRSRIDESYSHYSDLNFAIYLLAPYVTYKHSDSVYNLLFMFYNKLPCFHRSLAVEQMKQAGTVKKLNRIEELRHSNVSRRSNPKREKRTTLRRARTSSNNNKNFGQVPVLPSMSAPVFPRLVARIKSGPSAISKNYLVMNNSKIDVKYKNSYMDSVRNFIYFYEKNEIFKAKSKFNFELLSLSDKKIKADLKSIKKLSIMLLENLKGIVIEDPNYKRWFDGMIAQVRRVSEQVLVDASTYDVKRLIQSVTDSIGGLYYKMINFKEQHDKEKGKREAASKKDSLAGVSQLSFHRNKRRARSSLGFRRKRLISLPEEKSDTRMPLTQLGIYEAQPFQMCLRLGSGKVRQLTSSELQSIKDFINSENRQGNIVYRIGYANHFPSEATNDLDVVIEKKVDVARLVDEGRSECIRINEALSIDCSIVAKTRGNQDSFDRKLQGSQTVVLASGFRRLYIENNKVMLGELILPRDSTFTMNELRLIQSKVQFKLYPKYRQKLLDELGKFKYSQGSVGILSLKKHFCFLLKLVARHQDFSHIPSLRFLTQYTNNLIITLNESRFFLFDAFLFDYMDGYREGLSASLSLLSTNIDIGIKVWALSMLNFWGILESQVSGLLLSSSSSLEGGSASIK